MTDSQKAPYLDPSLPLKARVKDLVSRMTLSEKLSQMTFECDAISRLGIPAYNYWSEGLHGVARNGRATVFPQAIAMAASWDVDMVKRVASAIGDEARAKFHETLRTKGGNALYQGLTFWSPNVNIFRDPRWGRGQETWGEDPFFTGEMGSAFVTGLQGDDPRYMKAAACAKHYAVHSGPEKDRHTFNAIVSQRDLNDTYLPAFKKLVVDAKVESVMGAYNRTLDEACNASKLLLDEKLRKEWGFDGHVVSDCGAIADFHMHHKVTKDAAESAALAVTRGCDIECGSVYDFLGEALERGLLKEADIDCALERTLATRFKLGLFDPDELVPFASTPMSVVNSEEHRRLAYESALETAVLLKNKNDILPIRKDIKTILVTGPAAASLEVLLGNYHGLSDTMTTLLSGFVARQEEGVQVEYRPGCLWMHPKVNTTHDWIYEMTARMDLTVCCMGISPQMEGEEGDAILTAQNGDRTEIELPKVQVEFVKRLVASGGKVVLVLTGGSPIALGELEDMVEAVIYVWYPGQEGGYAVADLLFGNAAPSGKLPLTFPKATADLPAFEDYDMSKRTYRYSTVEPMYPFGFGLSYTTFAYSGLKVPATVKIGDAVKVECTLTNTGSVAATEVAQVYLSDLAASALVPMHKLVAFQRVPLAPGESKIVSFTLDPQCLAFVGEDGKQHTEPGKFRLTVGGCSPSARGEALGAPQPQAAEFELK
jgi:beta-glucosidase